MGNKSKCSGLRSRDALMLMSFNAEKWKKAQRGRKKIDKLLQRVGIYSPIL